MGEYSYGEKEFGVANILNDISYRVSQQAKELIEEKIIDEVEKIQVKDISLHIIPGVDHYEEIRVFTHRLAISFYGHVRGRYLNVLTFHSPSIIEQEYQAFIPSDFEIIYENRGVKVESKYILQDEEQSIIRFLNAVHYHTLFQNKFEKDIVFLLNKIGYKAENEDFEE